jgi:hypothetical protein
MGNIMKNDKTEYRPHKSSDRNRLLKSRLDQAHDRVPEDFTYDDLESWKYAHQSHGEILDFINMKVKE